MAINGDYPQPVTVNGFSCKNCTDVDYAKKHVDPAHPKDGPYGVNATDRDAAHDSGKSRGPDKANADIRRNWSEAGVVVDVQA